MRFLPRISKPADLAHLGYEDLDALAGEIRTFLVDKVSKTGGHLGPNLGVVELTIALHRVFASPTDAIVWDTGHQTYVHKLLTGRAEGFDALRQAGGLSGYPSRTESQHDILESSHASAALSWADGIAKGWELQGQLGTRHVVAVVGDGALTGGMAWEALNNIAAAKERPLVIVVNDNARSYSPTIGGLAHHLSTLRVTNGYEKFLSWGKKALKRTPVVGGALFEALHGMKKGLKDMVAPQGMFEDLGLKYVGPIDGHNIAEIEGALRRAKTFSGPVIVHCITEKGRGYQPAAADELEKFHAIGTIDPVTGIPLKPSGPSWTSVFSDELVRIGHDRPDVVAITAAMLGPTGLDAFAEAFPERTFDVGIAEQHGAASAAGLAFAGMHPVFAVYATFLNRAFDQVLMDCALHRAGVTFVLDRAGATGDDGASHNGMWDMAMLRIVPDLRVAAPRDESTLRAALCTAVSIADAPTVVRYPKGVLAQPLLAVRRVGGVDILRDGEDASVLIVGYGVGAHIGIGVAELLAAQGITAMVVDPVWIQPTNPELLMLAAHRVAIATIEDGVRVGGAGSALASALVEAGIASPVHNFGLPTEFFEHQTRAQLLAGVGLTASDIARELTALVSRGAATMEDVSADSL
jgi:1-deoxy-D-xylulose-5-phosphate synthase